MARGIWWAAAAVAAVAVLGSGFGCGEARAPSGAAANALGGCSSCHAGPGEGPPFRDSTGATDPRLTSVGAHDAHLQSDLSPTIGCQECHTVPRTVTDPGHLEDSPGDLRFGPIATTGGVAPEYDPEARTCATAYCHGNFPGGNGANRPVWMGRGVGGAMPVACGSCHGTPPQTGAHPGHAGRTFEGKSILCTTCHGDFVQATHVNGSLEVPLPVWSGTTRMCAQACHGVRGWDERAGE